VHCAYGLLVDIGASWKSHTQFLSDSELKRIARVFGFFLVAGGILVLNRNVAEFDEEFRNRWTPWSSDNSFVYFPV
jgi:hypothetical protein